MGCIVTGIKSNQILQQNQQVVLALIWEVILVIYKII